MHENLQLGFLRTGDNASLRLLCWDRFLSYVKFFRALRLNPRGLPRMSKHEIYGTPEMILLDGQYHRGYLPRALNRLWPVRM